MAQKLLSVPGLVLTGAATAGVLGTWMHSARLFDGNACGLRFGPVRLGPDVDLTRPMDVYLTFQIRTVGTNTNVSYAMGDTQALLNGNVLSQSVNRLMVVPSTVPANNVLRLHYRPISGVTDHTYPGGYAPLGTTIGWSYSRSGRSLNDTWNNDIWLAATLELWYSPRCQLVCCS